MKNNIQITNILIFSIACVGIELENASTFFGVSSMPKARPPTKARGVSFRNLAHRPRSIRRGCHRHQYLSERGMWPRAPPNLCNQVCGGCPRLGLHGHERGFMALWISQRLIDFQVEVHCRSLPFSRCTSRSRSKPRHCAFRRA